MPRTFFSSMPGLHRLLFVSSLVLVWLAAPAFAMGRPPGQESAGSGLTFGLLIMGGLATSGLALLVAVLLSAVRRFSILGVLVAALAALILSTGGGFAGEIATEVQTPAGPIVVFSWGPWVTAAAQMATEILVLVGTPLFLAWAYKTFPLASMFLREELVERTLRKWLDAGVAATRDATKDATLNVNVGSTVVANTLQRGLNRANADKVSAYVWKTAGGPEEVARKITRMLKLEPNASGEEVAKVALERADIPHAH